MIEKIEKLLNARGLKQSKVERQLGLAGNRISRWKGGMGEPTARQGLALAQLLGVSLDWLADDSAPDDVQETTRPPGASGLTEDERAVVSLYRALQIGEHEAMRRLAGHSVETIKK